MAKLGGKYSPMPKSDFLSFFFFLLLLLFFSETGLTSVRKLCKNLETVIFPVLIGSQTHGSCFH